MKDATFFSETCIRNKRYIIKDQFLSGENLRKEYNLLPNEKKIVLLTPGLCKPNLEIY
jgi:hypothetical protein